MALRKIIHRVLHRVIPWKFWNWHATTRLMRLSYLCNREEYDRLASEHERRRA